MAIPKSLKADPAVCHQLSWKHLLLLFSLLKTNVLTDFNAVVATFYSKYTGGGGGEITWPI